MVEKAALHRNLSAFVLRKVDPQLLAADSNEFHRVERGVRPILNLFRELEFFQDRPAPGIDAIAANFFAGKFFALQN